METETTGAQRDGDKITIPTRVTNRCGVLWQIFYNGIGGAKPHRYLWWLRYSRLPVVQVGSPPVSLV